MACSAMFLCEVEYLQRTVLTADLRQLINVHAMAYALKDDLTRNRASIVYSLQNKVPQKKKKKKIWRKKFTVKWDRLWVVYW